MNSPSSADQRRVFRRLPPDLAKAYEECRGERKAQKEDADQSSRSNTHPVPKVGPESIIRERLSLLPEQFRLEAETNDLWLSTRPHKTRRLSFTHAQSTSMPRHASLGSSATGSMGAGGDWADPDRSPDELKRCVEDRSDVLALLNSFDREVLQTCAGPGCAGEHGDCPHALTEEQAAGFRASAGSFSAWPEIEHHDSYAAGVPVIARSLAGASSRDRERSVCDERSRYSPLTDEAVHRLRMWFPHLKSPVKGCRACDECPRALATKPAKGQDTCYIHGEHLHRLRSAKESIEDQWLNDEVVNAYFGLLVERSLRFESQRRQKPRVRSHSSWFYHYLVQREEQEDCEKEGSQAMHKRRVASWDLQYLDMILIPIHNGEYHWSLAVVHVQARSIEFLDSANESSAACLERVLRWCCEFFSSFFGTKFERMDFTTHCRRDIPGQRNLKDCAVFVCKYADFMAMDHSIDFTQAQMQYFRARMAHELLVSYVA